MVRGVDVRGADVACGTRTDATRHARPRGRATRAHAWRRWRTGRAQVLQTRGRDHADARVAPPGRGAGK